MADLDVQLSQVIDRLQGLILKQAVLEARVDRAERQLGIAPPPAVVMSPDPPAPVSSQLAESLPSRPLRPEASWPVPSAVAPSPQPFTPGVPRSVAPAPAQVGPPMQAQSPAPTAPPLPPAAAPISSIPFGPVRPSRVDVPPPVTPPPSIPVARGSAPPPPPPRNGVDWETLIGGKWALWIGSLSLFLALACFLAYTWKSLPPAPRWAQVAIGIALGFGLIGAGVLLRPRTQRWFNEGLMGTGLALIYLSTWAGARYFGIIHFGPAFMSMALTTTLGVYLAVRYDAPSLSVLAAIGGFLTPLLLHERHPAAGEAANHLSLLGYIAVLDAGILAVSLFKRWRNLTWLSFIGTLLVVGAWLGNSSQPADRWNTFAFETLYFLLFIGAACFYSLLHREQTAEEDLLLLFSTTAVYALAGNSLIHHALGHIPGAFPLFVAFFFGFVAAAVRALAPLNSTLRTCAAGLALFFLTIALPAQLNQLWLPVAWSLEAGLLLILATRLRARLLQGSGQIVWGLSLLSLIVAEADAAPVEPVLLLNHHAFPLLVSVLMAAVVTAVVHTESRRADGFADALGPLYAMYAVMGGAWLVLSETYHYLGWMRPLDDTVMANALYIIACELGCYALIAFALGIRARHTIVRVSALSLMALAISLPVLASSATTAVAWTPFWSLRFGSFCVVAACVACMGRLIDCNRNAFATTEGETLEGWPLVLAPIVLTALSFEVYGSFCRAHEPSSFTWPLAAWFALSMLWSGFALLLGWYSRGEKSASLQTMAQCIAFIAVCVLLVDSVSAVNLDWSPCLNWRMVAFAFNAMAVLIAARALFRSGENDDAACTEVVAGGLLLWGASQEIYESCRHFRDALGAQWPTTAFLLISMLWHVSALALLLRGMAPGRGACRSASYIVGSFAVAVLLTTALAAHDPTWAPFFNLRFAAFMVGTVSIASAALALNSRRSHLGSTEIGWVAVLGTTAALLALWGLTQELCEACYYYRAILGEYWTRWAQMALSLLWSLYGTGLLLAGIRLRYGPLRHIALALLGITVFKVFLFDLGFLTGPLRILSLAGLGLALIFISWLYARFRDVTGDWRRDLSAGA